MVLLKEIITKIYGITRQKNFILFLKEAELRYNLRDKSKDEIFNLLKDYFKEIYTYNKFVIKSNDIN